MNEVWKPITGYELMYSVSNLGNIRNDTTGLNLKPWKNWEGYLLVDLYSNGKATHKSVHRLVAEAFLGSKHGMQVNHKNEVKSDNRLGNLEWVTQKENINYGTGNYRKGMAKRVKVVSRSLSGEDASTTELLKRLLPLVQKSRTSLRLAVAKGKLRVDFTGIIRSEIKWQSKNPKNSTTKTSVFA